MSKIAYIRIYIGYLNISVCSRFVSRDNFTGIHLIIWDTAMSSNCSSCEKKVVTFISKVKCKECGQGFCTQCIRKNNGCFCRICSILNTRPVNESEVMSVRSKEIKLYLARRKIPTENCLEKKDLFFRLLTYTNNEKRPPKNSKKSGYLNGIMSSFTNSMPNLLETNTRGNGNVGSQTSVPHEQPSSSRPARPTTFSETHQRYNYTASAPPPPPAPPTTTTYAESTSSTSQSQTENTTRDTARKLVMLSDIHNVVQISDLTVKQLKEILFINRVDFKGCVEKEELTKKVIDLWANFRREDAHGLSMEDLCKICMDAPLNSVLLECGHIATCIDCGKQLAECPICRQYVHRALFF
ncbi:uncharacterized protein CBL_00475 [Carabus blaptoides fortunei]